MRAASSAVAVEDSKPSSASPPSIPEWPIDQTDERRRGQASGGGG